MDQPDLHTLEGRRLRAVAELNAARRRQAGAETAKYPTTSPTTAHTLTADQLLANDDVEAAEHELRAATLAWVRAQPFATRPTDGVT